MYDIHMIRCGVPPVVGILLCSSNYKYRLLYDILGYTKSVYFSPALIESRDTKWKAFDADLGVCCSVAIRICLTLTTRSIRSFHPTAEG